VPEKNKWLPGRFSRLIRATKKAVMSVIRIRMRRKWRNFTARCAGGRRGQVLFERLDALYSGKERSYHNWRHILACLNTLKRRRSRCRNPVALEMAVWFHDAVYDPRRADNEAASARLALRAGAELGLEAALLDQVKMLILLTDHRAPPPPSPFADDARLLLDIDLEVLGSSRSRYAGYEAAVRREYAFVAEPDYRRGRSRLLQEFLRRPAVYTGACFGRRRERRARRNLKSALDRLGHPSGSQGGRLPGRGPGV
jgi:predicted metal-dependent HD superfamily phosphohydrolase